MTDESTPRPGRAGRIALGVGLLAAGSVAGGVLAGTVSASASTGPASTTAGTPAATGYGDTDGPNQRTFPPGGQAPVRSDEKAVGSALEAKLRAAALKAVPGGTVYRVESDAGDGTYEAHMTKADGTLVTVKFAKDGSVTKVEDGMGTGDPQPGGDPSH